MRALVFLGLVAVPLVAHAQDDATKCTDAYSDCTDSCALRFGMVVRDAERLKLAKCVDKCRRVQAECRERFFETKNNALDDGALDKKRERDDDLREDNKKTAIVPDEKPAKKQRDPAEDQPKRTSTRADELGANKEKDKKAEGTSSSDDPRYNMKFEEEKKPEPKKEEAPAKQANLDSDVRKEDSEPPKTTERKKSDTSSSSSSSSSSSEEPKKKKKERALDEWDPEAL